MQKAWYLGVKCPQKHFITQVQRYFSFFLSFSFSFSFITASGGPGFCLQSPFVLLGYPVPIVVSVYRLRRLYVFCLVGPFISSGISSHIFLSRGLYMQFKRGWLGSGKGGGRRGSRGPEARRRQQHWTQRNAEEYAGVGGRGGNMVRTHV